MLLSTVPSFSMVFTEGPLPGHVQGMVKFSSFLLGANPQWNNAVVRRNLLLSKTQWLCVCKRFYCFSIHLQSELLIIRSWAVLFCSALKERYAHVTQDSVIIHPHLLPIASEINRHLCPGFHANFNADALLFLLYSFRLDGSREGDFITSVKPLLVGSFCCFFLSRLLETRAALWRQISEVTVFYSVLFHM